MSGNFVPVLTTMAEASGIRHMPFICCPVMDTDLAFFAAERGEDGVPLLLSWDQARARGITENDIRRMAGEYMTADDYTIQNAEWLGCLAVRIFPRGDAGLICACNPYALREAEAALGPGCLLAIDRDSVLCVRTDNDRELRDWVRCTGSGFPSVYTVADGRLKIRLPKIMLRRKGRY